MTTKDLKKLEDILWKSADNLRANSDLSSNEYSAPVLGLIFLKFADNQYAKYEKQILAEFEKRKGERTAKEIHKIAIEICGLYLPEYARYDYLLNLPGDEDIAAAIKKALVGIESYVSELQDVLPKDEYSKLTRNNKEIPKELLRNFSNIPKDAAGDVLGQIYEYFLGKFALAEGQGGGEFFTPKSVVRLMVQIIEPHRGSVYDPACGSGGMFVQSARFIAEHNPENQKDVFVRGQEKTLATVNLAKMNLVVNNLRGEIRQANTYYEDPFESLDKFDYVLANPPFNVDDVNINQVENQERFNRYGIPRNKTKLKKKDAGKETVPNANYLWINLFATSLNETGRAGLVMANSASDARNSEAVIRQKLIENKLIYGMLTLPSNMFYTVTLPATLWFFDKGKTDDDILFIDARNVFTQIDRAHREFSDEQILNLSLISRLHRGKRNEFINTVHNYFEQSFAELEPLKETIEDNSNLFNKFIKSFTSWFNKPTVTTTYSALLKDGANKPEFDFKTELTNLTELNITAELKAIEQLITENNSYTKKVDLTKIDSANSQQIKLKEQFQKVSELLSHLYKTFDKQLRKIETLHQFADKELKEKTHKLWKEITNLKELRTSLSELHDRLSPNYLRDSDYLEKSFTYFLHNINWLQERFPEAKYEDVIGLCKLASIAEIKEQDYSLNPGRYVGVVIEDDGMTEEEFLNLLKQSNHSLKNNYTNSRILHEQIESNILQLLNNYDG